MQGQENIFASLLPLIVLFGIFYFLIIRPQQKQAKAHQEMLSALSKGDKIITNGGLICDVVKAEEEFIKVKLNDDTIVKIARDFVAKKIEKLKA